MAQDSLRIEMEILRVDLQRLEQRCREWHSSKGLFLYVGCIMAFLVICHIFGAGIELGRTGVAITAMVALACFIYYWDRSKKDEIDDQRARQIRENLHRYSIELGLKAKG